MLVSVIVPIHVYNETLNKCLIHLAKYSANENVELILVLDGIASQEEYFQNLGLNHAKIFSLQKNQGPAVARNFGAQQASGEILFFMDSDVQIKENTISSVKNHLNKSSDTEAIIGSYDDQPYFTTTVSKFRNLLHHHTHQISSSNVVTFWAGCGAIRRSTFQEVGGFNEQIKEASVEDIELGYRLTFNGSKIKLIKSWQVKHLKKWSFLSMIKTDLFLRAIPWTKFLHQYKSWQNTKLNVSNHEKIAAALLCFAGLSFILTGFVGELVYVGSIFLILLFTVKFKTYSFLMRHFSFWKWPVVIILHWVYLATSVMGYVIGTLQFYLQSNRQSSISKTSSVQ